MHDVQAAMRAQVDDGWAIQATRAPDGGTGAERQAQLQIVQAPCHARDDPLRQPMGQVMASCAPGLLVGGEEADSPQDTLDLERWFRQPKGHERRRHGHRHAGVRLVQEGPTLLLALDAHRAPPEPCTTADGWPYRHSPAPACHKQARHRRAIMRRARAKKKRPLLLAELERRYFEAS